MQKGRTDEWDCVSICTFSLLLFLLLFSALSVFQLGSMTSGRAPQPRRRCCCCLSWLSTGPLFRQILIPQLLFGSFLPLDPRTCSSSILGCPEQFFSAAGDSALKSLPTPFKKGPVFWAPPLVSGTEVLPELVIGQKLPYKYRLQRVLGRRLLCKELLAAAEEL